MTRARPMLPCPISCKSTNSHNLQNLLSSLLRHGYVFALGTNHHDNHIHDTSHDNPNVLLMSVMLRSPSKMDNAKIQDLPDPLWRRKWFAAWRMRTELSISCQWVQEKGKKGEI